MKRISVICAALVLYCSHAVTHAALPAGTEIRAYLNETCVVSDEPYFFPDPEDEMARSVPFATLVVGKLAHALMSSAIRATAGGIGAAAQRKDMYFVAANDVNLYRTELYDSPQYVLTSRLGCATVVAGTFMPANSDCTHEYLPRQVPTMPIDDGDLSATVEREDDTVENVLKRANICLEGNARSVYEFRFEYSEDGTAFRVQHAGLWLNQLLSTNSKRAKRSLVYTVDMAQPGRDANMIVLASAWIHVGEVSMRTDTDQINFKKRSEWLAVPPLSGAAEQAYQRETAIHQDVYAEIEALERSVVRLRRTRDALSARLGSTSGNVRDALQAEIDDVEFRMLRAESLLDARHAEYEDLPHPEREYMPLTVRVSVIESRSEKRALAALAAYLEDNSEHFGEVAAAMVERSFDDGGEAASSDATSLAETREQYFDALVAVEEAEATGADDEAVARASLDRARDEYNAARTLAGIPEIE